MVVGLLKNKCFWIIVPIVMLLIIFSFLPIWTKALKSGSYKKINLWQKLFVNIDQYGFLMLIFRRVKMKGIGLIIAILIVLFGCVGLRDISNEDGKRVFIKGVARGIKGGLEVDGVWLLNLSIDQEKKYVGKLVGVTGYIEEASELVARVEYDEKNKPIATQGVEGKPPLVMKKIISIKILEE